MSGRRDGAERLAKCKSGTEEEKGHKVGQARFRDRG